MDWLLKFMAIWLSLDILIVATAWYGIATIKPLYPNWWRRVIADDDPEFFGTQKYIRY